MILLFSKHAFWLSYQQYFLQDRYGETSKDRHTDKGMRQRERERHTDKGMRQTQRERKTTREWWNEEITGFVRKDIIYYM